MRSANSQERLTKVECKLDEIQSDVKEIKLMLNPVTDRLSSLERFKEYSKGVVGFCILCIPFITTLMYHFLK